jgi:mRNA interferase MazF
MPSFSKGEVILVRYPFSDLTGAKVRPSIVAGEAGVFDDCLIVPLTSKTGRLRTGHC